MKKDVIAIVPAAGVGKRLSSSQKKPFVHISGAPLLVHTLKGLHAVGAITEIILVLGKDDREKGLKIVEAYSFNKVRHIVTGGKERQDSVYNALCLIKNGDIILIHDGVRPLVTEGLIKRVISEVSNKKIDGVVPGLPLKETLKEVGNNGFVISTQKRGKFWTIQTPQVFHFSILKRAYESAYREGFYATDDSALVERIGGKIKVIPGDPFNIKVTTPEDMEMVEYLLKEKS
ncbi:MAG: 2-C-methyl-D-erythritol 4-phosphate cytidylyltransferase [Nitrospirae bacterium]|nr:2-C-methyl-D-erythritol 4-phosphate cytidylyltransferase [Nitrospirota bacterium]